MDGIEEEGEAVPPSLKSVLYVSHVTLSAWKRKHHISFKAANEKYKQKCYHFVEKS